MRTAICPVALVLGMAASTLAQPPQLDVDPQVQAQLINDVDESTVAMHPATPFLESSSLLLADIDLDKIDVGAVTAYLSRMTGSKAFADSGSTMNSFLDSLRAGGVSHLFVSAATRSPHDGGPIVIIPCENPALVSGLAKVLSERAAQEAPQKVHVGQEVVIVGAEPAVERIRSRQGVNRPDLILPLERKAQLDHSLVISLPQEAKEELLAFWPEAYEIASLQLKLSPRQLVDDVVRIQVSLRLPPEPEMIISAEIKDANAAARVQAVLEQVLASHAAIRSSVELSLDASSVELRAKPEAFVTIASTLLAPAREQAARAAKMNSMKYLGLGLHGYHAKEKHFPPRALKNEQGVDLMSWRVAILPHIDQAAMHRVLKLDQAWNSEANQVATSTLIPVYCDQPELGPKTTIRAPVYPGSLWVWEGQSKSIRDVTDGTSNTIALIDAPAAAAVEWANPEPWVLSQEDPLSDVFGDRDNVTVLMLDGSVRVFSREEMTNDKLKSLLTISGGEAVE